MATYLVPGDYESLAEALAEAAASNDVENVIQIGEPRVFTSWHVLDASFSADRQLTIRPGRGLRRAAVISGDGWHEIFRLNLSSYVNFQDLDLVRRWTTFSDLMFIGDCHEITLERCRIGSIWPSGDGGEWSCLRIKGPGEVMVRNCVFFAHVPGTFFYGIRIDFDTAMGNSLRLYNNVVADHRQYGIHATSPDPSDSCLLVRNNIVVNHPDLEPEPVPYHSALGEMIVRTSHNTAFVSLQDAETKSDDDAPSISGEGEAGFQRRSRAQVDAAFIQHTWQLGPEWDPNPHLFRLVAGGPLHSKPGDAGINVLDGDPDDRDVAVTDDIEQDRRPAGIPSHTDRGADQLRDGDSLLEPLATALSVQVPPYDPDRLARRDQADG